MKGLRTQETKKFERFFLKIQTEAAMSNSVFFADAGDGNDFITSSMEGENMMGWLVPNSRVAEFEPLWNASAVGDEWSDFYKWAIWSMNGKEITIRFEE